MEVCAQQLLNSRPAHLRIASTAYKPIHVHAGRSQELYYVTPDSLAAEDQDVLDIPAPIDSLQGLLSSVTLHLPVSATCSIIQAK